MESDDLGVAEKFIAMVVGSMEMTNQLRTLGCKPRSVSENCDSSSHRKDDQGFLVTHWDRTCRPNSSFRHDGSPAHFSITLHTHLNATYPGIWIGHGCWLTVSSLYLNPLDLFFQSHQKSLVYETSVTNVRDLKARIVIASADITRTLDSFE
ncbi:uncharacterized protein TNCV_3445691 [Trichonephila clavipes]|nr:uncharacterized protein TNCV_3445691 [Trichonephila clavipes]